MLYIIYFTDGSSGVFTYDQLQFLLMEIPEDILSYELYEPEPPPPVYTCPYCGATFSTQAELDAHIQSQHPAPPPAYEGTLTRMELEYDETWGAIPVYNIPQGQRGLLHIWGRNDMATTQQMGIYWFVADLDGFIVQEYEDWEMWPYTSPGVEHGFLAGRFNLDKVGKYTMWVELLMNRDDPQVVDRYIGDLCTVVAAVPESEFRYFALSEYTK